MLRFLPEHVNENRISKKYINLLRNECQIQAQHISCVVGFVVSRNGKLSDNYCGPESLHYMLPPVQINQFRSTISHAEHAIRRIQMRPYLDITHYILPLYLHNSYLFILACMWLQHPAQNDSYMSYLYLVEVYDFNYPALLANYSVASSVA